MSRASIFSFWSPTLGCDAVRLSMTDERGSEYFAVIPAFEGSDGRRRKTEALEAIQEAISRGLEPGRVRWT